MLYSGLVRDALAIKKKPTRRRAERYSSKKLLLLNPVSNGHVFNHHCYDIYLHEFNNEFNSILIYTWL